MILSNPHWGWLGLACLIHAAFSILSDQKHKLICVIYTGCNFTLANIQSEIVEITDWRSLGYQLHIPKHQLDAIEEDFRRVQRCKEEVLSFWLRNDVYASWELLVTAIRRLRTHNVLANHLQRKYVQNGSVKLNSQHLSLSFLCVQLWIDLSIVILYKC